MTLVLQESSDCQHLSNPVDEKTCFQPKTYEFQLYDPKGMSHGYRNWYYLRPGISLLVDNYTLEEELIVETSPSLPIKYIELSFTLLGKNNNEEVLPGYNFFSCYIDSGNKSWIKWQPQKQICKLDIHLELSHFENLINHQIDLLPKQLQAVIKTEDEKLEYFNLGVTTPLMQSIIKQILHCPYQGLTKQLYLEGKILELVSLRLENLQDASCQKPITSLKPYQIESIYQARDILIKNIHQPPSLLSLAHQVGLNDCILKKGFQELFGTTAFGYLHKYRMEKAKELLQEFHMNVTQVAQAVGYESRSSFVRAFSKQFGASPSVYIQKNSV